MSLHEQHMAIVDSAAEYADVEGLRILVPRGVYHPHEWSSTRFLLAALHDIHELAPDNGLTPCKALAPCKGLDILEIGGGSGALALAIKQRGANKVVATDISDKACATMECNALLNNLEIDVRQGDMFAPLRKGELFDLVIFNLPLMNKPVANETETALCDPDGELLTKFLQSLPNVVNSGGQALFTHANISAPLPLGIPGRIQPVAETRRVGSPQGDGFEVLRVLWWRP